jgi:hypothetical protein
MEKMERGSGMKDKEEGAGKEPVVLKPWSVPELTIVDIRSGTENGSTYGDDGKTGGYSAS